MRRFVPLLCAAALAACSDSPVEVTRAPAPRLNVTEGAAETGRHVVLMSRGAGRDDFARTVASLGGTLVTRHDAAGFAVVEGLSAEGAARLARAPGVHAVEADLVAQVVSPLGSLAEAVVDAQVGAASQDRPELAGLFGLQWNQGAIGSPVAWSRGRLGSSSVRVAILDSGIDDTWPDLAGLVDGAHSASFVPTVGTCLAPSDHELINGRAATATCPALPAYFPGKPSWADLNFHGTMTAGIVSSKAAAFAGVTSRVTLMAVKVLNARGSGAFSWLLEGVAYAADNEADVINMSLGANFLKHGGYISFLNAITRYAHSRGVTVVVAAGNDAIDLDHSGGVYAAFCSNGMVICVSATGPVLAVDANGVPSDFGPRFLPTLDEPAIYSNFGTSSVDVAAPGGNYALNAERTAIASVVWIWGGCSRTRLIYVPASAGPPPTPPRYVKSACTASLRAIGGYGTSAAGPHVAGLAALLVEDLGRHPGQIRTTIQQTADDLGKPGADPHYGKGRINVPRALGL